MPLFEIADELEVLNGACLPLENDFAFQVAQRLGKRGTGGSDAHFLMQVGTAYTIFAGSTPADLRMSLFQGTTSGARAQKRPRLGITPLDLPKLLIKGLVILPSRLVFATLVRLYRRRNEDSSSLPL